MNVSKDLTLTSSMPEYWERSYQSDEMGWDLGESTPIFNQWIKTCKEPLSICVLGAGNGWDALHIAQQGHVVTAVDFAASAVKNMQIASENNSLDIDICQMDIFDLNKVYTNHFDVVLEYTCFCAIDPSKRRDYLKIVRHILKYKGKLVGILFPTDKSPSAAGPPYAIDVEQTIILISEYLSLIKREIPTLSIQPRVGREVFVIFEKDGY